MESNDVLNILLKFSTDTGNATKDLGKLAGAAESAEKSFKGTEKAVKATEEAVKKTEKAIKEINFRDMAQQLGKVGQQLSNTGRGLSAMLSGSISAYLSGAGKFDAKAQKWNAAQQEIQAAYARIGSVSLDVLTPYLEKAADMIDKLADFVEKNPWIIKAAAGAAGALMSAGSIMSTTSTLMQLKGSLTDVASKFGVTGTSITSLLSKLGPGLMSAATKLGPLATQAGVYGLSAAAGAWMGHTIGNAGNKLLGQKEQSWGDNLQTAKMIGTLYNPLTYVAGGLKAIGQTDAASKVWDLSKSMVGLGDKAEETTDKIESAGQAVNTFAQDNVQAYIDYQKELADAEQSYQDELKAIEQSTADERVRILEDFSTRARSAESSYVASRNALISDYETSQAQAAQDYYAAQAAASAAFNLEMRRLAEDHKMRLRKLEQEHNAKVADLVASRDALGLAHENANYKQAVKDEDAQYKLEQRRRIEDHQLQMAEMARNFAVEQERRRQEFERQLAEKAAAFAAEQEQNRKDRDEALKSLEDHNKETLKKLKEGYDKETRMIQTNFIDRLNAMSQSISGSTSAWITYMQNQALEFQNWLNTIYTSAPSVGTSGIARAMGGGVLSGKTYLVGENGPELFTARDTGSIIPAGMTAAMLRGNSGGGSGRNITVNVQSKGLTMREVVSEVDQRLGLFEKRLTRAFG